MLSWQCRRFPITWKTVISHIPSITRIARWAFARRQDIIALLHYNRQGVIAQYTTILGDANINVSDMTNKTRGDFAYALLDIDAPVTPEVVEKLDAIEDMIRVRVVK